MDDSLRMTSGSLSTRRSAAKSCSLMLAMLVLLGGIAGAQELARLTSPDGRYVLVICQEQADETGLRYHVDYRGRPLISDSGLGLDLDDGLLGPGMQVVKREFRTSDQLWRPVCGERERIRDHYREVTLQLREMDEPHRMLDLTCRAYDEGVAFRYTVPAQLGWTSLRVLRERSEFRFSRDHAAWATYSAQGEYQPVTLRTIRPGCERPLVVRRSDDCFIALAEAKLVDYARMKFGPVESGSFGVISLLDGPVESSLPLTTPWRVVMAADRPGQLLENNFLLLNLNDPCAIEDPSWVRPGKVIREVSLTTQGGKDCVDFAVQQGLQYVEYDAGWYGHEYDETSDATTVNVDPKRSKGPLELREVIEYARERGIGIILYVNQRALERQLDELLPLYREWGIRGIKFGFVRVGSQQWTQWLHEAIRKCAAHQLMVDVHDEYRGTGYSRTYPNLMTVEGVRGDETSPTNEITLTYLFTRMIAGPADHTVCWMDPRVQRNATYAYQLAKPVCFFSPWQFLFWYDRPAAIARTPELEFFRELPTIWDETRSSVQSRGGVRRCCAS